MGVVIKKTLKNTKVAKKELKYKINPLNYNYLFSWV